MGIYGSFYGSFRQKPKTMGVFSKAMAVSGSFMGVPSTWLHLHRNNPDSAVHAREPSRQSMS